jgi:hypothetical protein
MQPETTSPLNLIFGCLISIASACSTSLAINLQANALKQERLLNNLSEDPQSQDLLEDGWRIENFEQEQVDRELENISPVSCCFQTFSQLLSTPETRHALYIKFQW